MNNARRKRIDEISQSLNDLKDEIDKIADEEQECFDNLPEGIQCSETGQAMEEAVDYMQGAIDATNEATCNLDDAKGDS